MTTATPTKPMTDSTAIVRLTDSETVLAAATSGAPAAFAEIRRRGAERFAEAGLPTRRDELWRYTSLRMLEDLSLDPAPAGAELSAADLERLAIPGLDGFRLVLVNGRVDAGHSRLDGLPAGVRVRSLAEAAGDAAVREALGSVSGDSGADEPFVALNDALLGDGVVIEVAAGVQMSEPIHLLTVAADSGDGGAAPLHTSRVLVMAGEDSSVVVIEDHAALGDEAVHLTNALTEVVVGDRGHVEHVLIERDSRAAVNISSFKSRQGAESRVESHSVLLGGRIVRNDVNPRLEGAKADSLLNGIYVPTAEQHMDNNMRVEHRVGSCTSRQYYRGLLPDQTTGVFTGRIVVSDDASETDAIQNCQNLLLSDDARAVTRPQLEIYDADVQCTHGATTGQLVPEQLFYLRARGVDEETARGLLVHAFAAEGIERISVEPVREWIHGQLAGRVPYAVA